MTAAREGELFLYEFMGELARARVVSVAGSGVQIFYMDYGNKDDSQLSQLGPVNEQVAGLPALVSWPFLGGDSVEMMIIIRDVYRVPSQESPGGAYNTN